MPAKKRTSPDSDDAGSEHEVATKVAKTTKKGSASKAAKDKVAAKDKAPAKKRGAAAVKSPFTGEEFTKAALPIHIHFTHTPPSISSPTQTPAQAGPEEAPNDTQPTKQTDPGHIASLTLLPSVFSTGSHGWKGNKNLSVEVIDPENGKKVVLSVQVGINAVVKGSKAGKDKDDADAEEEAKAVERDVEPEEEDEKLEPEEED